MATRDPSAVIIGEQPPPGNLLTRWSFECEDCAHQLSGFDPRSLVAAIREHWEYVHCPSTSVRTVGEQ